MPQHFLLSRPAKTLSLASVFRMTDTVNGGVKAGHRGGAKPGQFAAWT